MMTEESKEKLTRICVGFRLHLLKSVGGNLLHSDVNLEEVASRLLCRTSVRIKSLQSA